MSVQLTEAQQKAIIAPINQPSLILAAAGSGKTLVLCHRILHLLTQGVAAKNILAVTFSRRAGQDLLHRLRSATASVVTPDNCALLKGIHVRTFHSFCLAILRTFPDEAGLSPDFIVLTPKMQLQILEDLIRSWYEEKQSSAEDRNAKAIDSIEFKHFAKTYEKNKLGREVLRLRHQLRRLRSSKQSGSSLNSLNGDLDKCDELFEWVHNRYHAVVKSFNCIEFDDFPRLAAKVLQDCQSALTTMGLQAHYILVDEFQDTDVEQFQLLKLLCRDHSSLTIVGDDDQQIYTWRGAAGFYNLTMFDKVFCGATVTKLEQNFRSTGAIVAAARSIIAKNVNRTPKTIRTASPTGTILSVCECRNEQCEAAAVENFILSLKEQGISLRDIVILYRVQHVGLEIQEMLQERGIPCNTKGHGSGVSEGFPGISGYQRMGDALGAVLHDILAILRLVLSEVDDLSCKQVMEALCPDFYSTRVSKCIQHLQCQQGISLYQALITARSHMLGVTKQEDLSLCGIKELHQTDECVLESLHSLVRILETAKVDLKELRMKDVIMNLLQQISPFRTRATAKISSKGEGFSARDEGNCEFTGIKALIREASKFDMEWGSKGQDNVDGEFCASHLEAARLNGYKNLLHQKTARQSLWENYKLQAQVSPHKIQIGYVKRLQSFVDYITLKLHDGELGDCGAEPLSYTEDDQEPGKTGSLDSVVLSTIHQAKGLEWKAVILVRANEGVLPLMDCETVSERVIPQAFDSGFHIKSHDSNAAGGEDIMVLRNASERNVVDNRRNRALEALEEERRLMYVALTRAKQFLLITHVMFHVQQPMSPSRFLANIPKGLMRRTTCYDSKIGSAKSESIKHELDARIPNSTNADMKIGSKSAAYAQGIQKRGLQPDTKGKIGTKRQLESCKSVSKGTIDVEQSLKDIDELLGGMPEPANNTKARISTDVNLKRGAKGQVQKRPCFRQHGVLDSSSDDSDFETEVIRNVKTRAYQG